MRNLPTLGISAVLALAVPGRAQGVQSPLQFGAFGTLGVAATDTHQVDYPRDTSQPDGAIDRLNVREDSRLGIQGSYRFTDALSATLQLVSKYRYDGSYKPSLTWAALTWNPVSNLQVQAGRMGFDMFDKSMLRDVGYTYLWVRPPTEVFASVPFASVDGLKVEQSLVLGSSTLTLRALAGRAVGRIPLHDQGVVQDNGGSDVYGVTASLQSGPWRVRASLARVRNANELPEPYSQIPAIFKGLAAATGDPRLAGTGSLFTMRGAHSRTTALGINYDRGPVQASGYLAHSTFDRFLLPPNTTGYLSFGYRTGPVVPYLMYARIYSKRIQVPYLGALPGIPDPAVQQFTGVINTMVLSRNADQHTWSAGLRWDFAEHADFKLQIDQVRNPTGGPFMQVLGPDYHGRLMVMSAGVDFVFGGGRP